MIEMRLNKKFITHESGGENYMVSTGESGFHGLVRSNKTAAFIVECLKTEISENEIVEKMVEKYDAPRDVLGADVRRVLDTLRKIGALDEDNL